MNRGKFITLEGGEAAGKSTQVKLLATFLQGKGIDVVQTREVGGSPPSEVIREMWLDKGEGYWDPLTEVLLIMAARREHLVKTIVPALLKGSWVISDRFIDSTRAYQGVTMGVGLSVVESMYHQIAPDFTPDLTLLLDLPVDKSIARMKERGGKDDRYQQKDAAFHQKLRDAYLGLAKKDAQRFHIVNASGDIDAVAKAIEGAIAGFFKL